MLMKIKTKMRDKGDTKLPIKIEIKCSFSCLTLQEIISSDSVLIIILLSLLLKEI